jgi:sulfur carrier protein ThiS
MIHTLVVKGAPAVGPSIEVTLKLFAMLERWLPDGARRNEIRLSVPLGTTPADVVASLDLPAALCAIVLIDGAFVLPEARATRALAPGEVLSIWPPIAGG